MRDESIPAIPNHGVIDDSGQLAANYPWPAPSGCPTGRREWTQIKTLVPLVLEVQPGLVFFQCEPANDARTVDAIVARAIANDTSQEEIISQLMEQISALRILANECPSADINASCNTKRSRANARLNANRSRQTTDDTLRRAAAQFKIDNGLE